jgi:hypothetical protein
MAGIYSQMAQMFADGDDEDDTARFSLAFLCKRFFTCKICGLVNCLGSEIPDRRDSTMTHKIKHG